METDKASNRLGDQAQAAAAFLAPNPAPQSAARKALESVVWQWRVLNTQAAQAVLYRAPAESLLFDQAETPVFA